MIKKKINIYNVLRCYKSKQPHEKQIKYLRAILKKFAIPMIIIFFPIIIWLFYSVLLESPRYESMAIISVQKNQQGFSFNGLGSILGVDNNSSISSELVINYLSSLAMYQKLDNTVHLTKLFQNKNIDFFSRLSKAPNQKELLDYYKSRITMKYNSSSQTIEIKVQGFSPNQAKLILEQMVQGAQDFVNEMDQQLTYQRVKFGQKQVLIAQKKLLEANASIIKFQNDHAMIDPKTEIGIIVGLMANLQSQLVASQTALIERSSFYQSDSHEIQQLKERVDAINSQIAIEKQKLIGIANSSADPHLNAVFMQFEELTTIAKIAVGEYAASLQGLEMSKSEGIQQKQQIVIVSYPSDPDYAMYPRIGYNTLILLVMLSFIYGIIKMFIRIISEHQY